MLLQLSTVCQIRRVPYWLARVCSSMVSQCHSSCMFCADQQHQGCRYTWHRVKLPEAAVHPLGEHAVVGMATKHSPNFISLVQPPQQEHACRGVGERCSREGGPG